MVFALYNTLSFVVDVNAKRRGAEKDDKMRRLRPGEFQIIEYWYIGICVPFQYLDGMFG
jgi:hypothetical protein